MTAAKHGNSGQGVELWVHDDGAQRTATVAQVLNSFRGFELMHVLNSAGVGDGRCPAHTATVAKVLNSG
jgi:hypothetical protein